MMFLISIYILYNSTSSEIFDTVIVKKTVEKIYNDGSEQRISSWQPAKLFCNFNSISELLSGTPLQRLPLEQIQSGHYRVVAFIEGYIW